MFNNTIETIFTLMNKDTEDPIIQSKTLEAFYEISTDAQKKIINNTLICICRYSLDDIINNPENISMEKSS